MTSITKAKAARRCLNDRALRWTPAAHAIPSSAQPATRIELARSHRRQRARWRRWGMSSKVTASCSTFMPVKRQKRHSGEFDGPLADDMAAEDRVTLLIIDGRTTGFCKLVADRERHTILGCHIVGRAGRRTRPTGGDRRGVRHEGRATRPGSLLIPHLRQRARPRGDQGRAPARFSFGLGGRRDRVGRRRRRRAAMMRLIFGRPWPWSCSSCPPRFVPGPVAGHDGGCCGRPPRADFVRVDRRRGVEQRLHDPPRSARRCPDA